MEKFISDMREAVLSPELDDPEKLHAYTARFVEALIQRFERLVETGKLDGVLPRLAGLPILYSPNAGKGAGRWEYAARLCKEKRVGSESLLEYRDTDSALARNPIWRHLAHDTLWVVQDAVIRLKTFRALRERARPCFKISKKLSKEAKLAFQAEVFLLANDELLVWPDWLAACEAIPLCKKNGLPVQVKEAEAAYLKAARAVIDNFFADPNNRYAEEIVAKVGGKRLQPIESADRARKGKVASKRDFYRANAVAEARKNILASVRQLCKPVV